MAIDENWTVRRCRYAPEGASAGRVCLATGIHGDELMGQLIAYGVARCIAAQPECLHGIVDIYPMLNPLGLDVGDRMTPMNHLDMNRAFPGTKDGTALEAICHAIIEDMRGADLVLDIHSGTVGKSELYEVRLSSPHADWLLDQARALSPDLIWAFGRGMPPPSPCTASAFPVFARRKRSAASPANIRAFTSRRIAADAGSRPVTGWARSSMRSPARCARRSPPR